ncbi:MAG: hypothetical protein WA126_12380 [Thermodesulfovibrionales bacterium]
MGMTLKRVLLLIWCVLIFCSQNSYAEEIKNRKIVAYVGGVNELVKIDLEKYKIIKSLRFPGGGHIVFGLDISPDGKEIYVTGDMFSSPMIVVDSRTLEITKSANEEGFKDAKLGGKFGYYECRGKLSPDGRKFAIDCGTSYPTPFALMDIRTFKVVTQPQTFHNNPIYQAVFSDDSKLLYILTGIQFRQKKRIFEDKIIVLNTFTGKILKQSLLPELKNIKCETNISEYIGDSADIFITCNTFYDHHSTRDRGLLKGDEIYPFISEKDRKKIKLIEVKTGKTINEIPMPDGKGDLNFATLTPDKKKILIGRGGYRHPGELTIVDVKSKKVIKRIMLEGGATSNVVFRYE